MEVILETKRTYLRRFMIGDAPTILRWGQDSMYHQTAGFPVLMNISQAEQVAQKFAERPHSYGIILKENNQLIGIAELNDRGLDTVSGLDKTKDLGLMMDKTYWRQGIIKEVVHELFPFVFNELNQTELWSAVYPDNEKSIEMVKSFGFEYKYSADYSDLQIREKPKEDYYLLTKEHFSDLMRNKL